MPEEKPTQTSELESNPETLEEAVSSEMASPPNLSEEASSAHSQERDPEQGSGGAVDSVQTDESVPEEEAKPPESWFITGANGNLGQRLIRQLLAEGASVTAVVRSGRAEQSLSRALNFNKQLRIEVIDYAETMLLAQAAYGAQYAVHLVGILKATKNSTYAKAHEASCTALIRALKDTSVEHITYLSILGAKPSSGNACLASKGKAERILHRSPVTACTLRVPMVIGERDYASKMLAQRANLKSSVTFRASSLEQPIYAGDVVDAICAAARLGLDGGLNLAGPESLTREDLYKRAAAVLGRSTSVRSVPIFFGYAIAWLLELFSAEPPITRAMLGVLDHDDQIDVAKAQQMLGLPELTDLDTMLRKTIR
jgi:uncharacterized protein YbjT (DUF2867 family)